ncbi:hypothetical protein SK128_015786 [Halocaridina rubra]|uniref:Apple domain-containing protein n=1 Tax=Halocaridina rubra TaxID=373956 RepID=A0AAN8ZZ78_HALRR
MRLEPILLPLLIVVFVFSNYGKSKEIIFTRIYENQIGYTVNGNHVEYPQFTATRCGNMCLQVHTCWVFAFNVDDNTCRIYTYLNPDETPTTVSNAWKTFGAIGNYFFVNLAAVSNTWLQGEAMCQNASGTIAYEQDPERLKLLLQWGGTSSAWVGVELDTTVNVWYDNWGNTIPQAQWGPNEPEAPYIKSYYRFSGTGLYTIWEGYASTKPSLCVAP